MAGLTDSSLYLDGSKHNCPCSQDISHDFNLQSFIGNDYFCESGNQDINGQFKWGHLFSADYNSKCQLNILVLNIVYIRGWQASCYNIRIIRSNNLCTIKSC